MDVEALSHPPCFAVCTCRCSSSSSPPFHQDISLQAPGVPCSPLWSDFSCSQEGGVHPGNEEGHQQRSGRRQEDCAAAIDSGVGRGGVKAGSNDSIRGPVLTEFISGHLVGC